MLRTRMITGVLGAVVAAVAITTGGWLFTIFLAVLAAIAWKEFCHMMHIVHYRMWLLWGYSVVVGVFLALGCHAYGVAAFVIVMALTLLYLAYTAGVLRQRDIATHWGGITYTTLGFVALQLLRDPNLGNHLLQQGSWFPVGESLIWLLLLSVWASDSFAYFAGRSFGRTKIVPRISPNKTLEGFIGGGIGCIFTALIVGFIIGNPWGVSLILGILIAIFAPLGDLFESKLKRESAIKDSGRLLPGHGGVLDRFDSLLFAAPLVLAYLLML